MDRTTPIKPKTAILLEKLFETYHNTSFIVDDPICIPHAYTQLQDIEITAFFASVLAWGQRKTIIQKCKDLFQRMDNAPYSFILHHSERDLKVLQGFKHRTFNEIDLLHFVGQLQRIYRQYRSLEDLFSIESTERNVYEGLIRFHRFFLQDAPRRTHKHISSPIKNSACKRLNMFLRWMVRRDSPVDFGIWKSILPSQLVCPLDIHVEKAAKRLDLIDTKAKATWSVAVSLTELFKTLCPEDPVKYDYALFGLSRYGM
ncbi:MAG: TIGR02757 family protein [Bacteroidia bacterium]|nr:TIGR02757 family protein [Bacteroidia bacterium]MDW8346295.1 TIGR02757 family protein [Bacteroidia bacterium]